MKEGGVYKHYNGKYYKIVSIEDKSEGKYVKIRDEDGIYFLISADYFKSPVRGPIYTYTRFTFCPDYDGALEDVRSWF